MKSKLSILFIFIMSVLTASSCMLAGAATQVYSEAGLTYTVNSDSTATVTGFSGEVIENLTIPETLGGYTVTAIGANAFENCSSLKSIKLCEGITTFGAHAFLNCTSLTEVTFPSTVTDMSNYGIFTGCDNLVKISFAEGTVRVVDYACVGASELKEVILPETVTEVGYKAFADCGVLESISLPNSVSVIGSYAFDNCTSLKSIDLNEGITEIGVHAFLNCKSLSEITIPATLTEVTGDYGIFTGCDNLKKVIFAEGTVKVADKVCNNAQAVTEVVLPESVTEIGYDAFKGCKSLLSIRLPENIIEIGSGAFEGCESLVSINLPQGITVLNSYVFGDCTSLKSIKLHEGITGFGDHVFLNCTSLTEVTFPSTVTDMSDYGIFTGCNNLVKISFAEGTVRVVDYACVGASKLKEVILPETVTEVGYKAFADCGVLESISLPNNVSVIDSYAFSSCTSLQSIDLNEGITEIGVHAFLNCKSLGEITFPATLAKVSTDTIFTGCKNLKKVIFAEGTVKIANNVCKSAPAITQVVIPDTVKTIGNSAFANCKTLKTIDLNKVETLEASAFSGCTGLTVITVPESLKYTTGKVSPFNGCSNITSIIFEGTTIPSYFCRNMAALHTIDMKNGLTAVGNNAFYAIDNLKTFIIRDRNCAIPDTEGAIVSGATIYGYELSTAQEYAEKYNRSFVALEASDSYEAVADYVRRQMINRNRYIILAYPQGAPVLTSNNDFVKFFDAVFVYDKADPAAGDYIRWSVKKINRAVLDDGYLVLDVDYYTTAEQESLLSDKITEIAASLQLNDKPEYEKARLIFEYLCDNVNAVSPNDKAYNDVHHSAYSVLVNNSGVCEGFSLAFYRLALEADLDTRVVVSDKLLHACNIVRIADQWYYIDAYLAADEDDSSRGDVFYFLKSSVEAQFIGNDYIAFTPVYENQENWALTPAEIKTYSFAGSDYIVDGGCGHILEFIGYTGKPCSGTGKEEYKCPKCGNEFSRSCKLGHTALSGSIRCQWCNKNLCKHEEQYRALMPERKATCTEEGLTSYEYCSRCKEHNFSDPELIPATGHSDKNNDGVCDQCGTTIGKKENSFIAKIKQFFGKISRFLAKLFGKKK